MIISNDNNGYWEVEKVGDKIVLTEYDQYTHIECNNLAWDSVGEFIVWLDYHPEETRSDAGHMGNASQQIFYDVFPYFDKAKIRRRIEDALRKSTSVNTLLSIARILGVRI